jgi:hypothetical protein
VGFVASKAAMAVWMVAPSAMQALMADWFNLGELVAIAESTGRTNTLEAKIIAAAREPFNQVRGLSDSPISWSPISASDLRHCKLMLCICCRCVNSVEVGLMGDMG